ncbi:GAF domain-containing protein [Sphingomonas trueperi]|uniref:GAF domain-containing protein n=1 Tax=Sphingomonas trueperi TaxID=53317 RepID=UPI000EB4ABB4
MRLEKAEGEPQHLIELRRQARVLTSGVFGMRGDAELSQIVEDAAKATRFPFAAVSIVDRSRLWLAVAYGFDPREFDRPDSFCDAAIKVPGFAPLCVADAWQEQRFQFAPAVIEMNVRAYYAAPLVTSDGLALGTLCLLDQKPRKVGADALDTLRTFAGNASAVIDRESNAVAYAEFAIAELSSRIRFAMAERDEETVGALDAELRRLEATLEPNWQSSGVQAGGAAADAVDGPTSH